MRDLQEQLPIEDFLRDAFEDNFQHLKMESAHTIPPALKELAWRQVLLYWQKLRHIAENVTETEVKLILPEQITPKSRKYTIEGIVDIIEDDGKVVMYDLKTHDERNVRAFPDNYSKQLNVYAHIWQNLRGQQLDEIAILAIAPPDELLDAIDSGDVELIEKEMEKWNPVVNLDFDQDAIEECIGSFGATVDNIEDSNFSPPEVKKLRQKMPGREVQFGTAVCRYCDARFSCDSYRAYVRHSKPNLKGFDAMRYYLEDYGEDSDRANWLEHTLNADQGE